jgi:peptidoglycan hydrolase-like protein with peptidoglycan-binding domain
MKIVISSGHGKYIRGASGYLDEVNEARRVVEAVANTLGAAGVGVVTFHDDISDDQSENLNRIVNFHNSQTRDLDVSVHFNAYQTTPNPMGTECLYVTQSTLSGQVAGAIAKAGSFINRGAKYRGDLFFLNNTQEPAILIEVCFVDSKADANLYGAHYDAICHAIAEAISGQDIGDTPPVEPPGEQPPSRPENPYDTPLSSRPVLGMGDEGWHVEDLQTMLNWELRPSPNLTTDGDFGGLTEEAVMDYQATRGLDYDGIAGEQTWTALYAHKEPLPPPPHALTEAEIEDICHIANESVISNYSWDDRGIAPVGYMQGMACAFAQSVKKLKTGHPAVLVMASARTNSDKDALNVYRSEFDNMRMSNEDDGIDTLRHLYALMLGSGMRESSGRHCEGRDQSATNTSSDTAEAGLFQTSYNAHSASDPEFSNLMAEYSQSANKPSCYLSQFDDGVSCSSSEWSCYGSGKGYDFQQMCKECPAFAVESHGLTLRNLCNHYGPIIRKEVELKSDADRMFKQVQAYLDEGPAVAKKKPGKKKVARR